MNTIKKIFYNIFFKKKKNSISKKKQKMNFSVEASTSKNKGISNKKRNEPQIKKYDLTALRNQISKTDYIENLRINRSWIFPQLIHMGFNLRGRKKNNNSFSLENFRKAIISKYDTSIEGRFKIWSLIKRNYKVIAASEGCSPRTKWWTKDVLLDLMKWDFSLVGKASRGVNRSKCLNIIEMVKNTEDPQQLYDLVKEYDKNRMRNRNIRRYSSLPESFITAFEGDGAYNSMMTMIKIYGLRITNSNNESLDREECIKEIEKQSETLNGHQLLEFCKFKFFDSNVFELKKYI